MERNIARHLWLGQEPTMFQHHFALLWCLQASHHPGWCLPEGPWSCPSTGWMPSHLCIQGSNPHWTMLCQYRAWATCLCFWCRAVPRICLQLQVHDWEWSQTPRADYAEEPGRCTSLPPENAVMPPGLWHPHQIPTWQRDAHSRCPFLLCPSCCPWDTSQHLCELSAHHPTEEMWLPGCCLQWPNSPCPSRDDPLRLARKYTWCSREPLPISPCP